jgi:tRNA dimethylallyltransferase
VAIGVAQLLRRDRGEDPVAISCDAIQVYQGLETLSGAPDSEQRERLEHRLLGIVPVEEEFSAGRFAELAHVEIDSLLGIGRRPIVVGGTGLYLRAALSELELRPPVDAAIRAEVEREISERGPAALHAEIRPEIRTGVHPNDRKRISRTVELQRAGVEPPRTHDRGGKLWTADLRQPTVLVGLTADSDELGERIDLRVDAMFAAGAQREAARAVELGASRTARAALGFEEFLRGDPEGVKRAHRAYARRQRTWLRRMEGVTVIDRSGRPAGEVAEEITGLLG